MKKTIGFIGSGAVAAGLAQLISGKGRTIASITGRNTERVRFLAERIGIGHYGSNLSDTVRLSEITFICTTDDSIMEVAEKLSDDISDLTGKIVFHTSGSATSTILASLKEKGANTGSFHPLQTFPGGTEETVTLEGCAVALEGDAEALRAGNEITITLGAYPLVLSAELKTLYHASATIASNGLIALTGAVEELYGELKAGDDGLQYYYRLMQQSLSNSMRIGAVQAITGPVARGDLSTLKRHIGDLRRRLPHIIPLYIVLGSHCVQLALAKGTISEPQAGEIMEMFSNELQSLTM
jgi:predicted short-subunit dehydrogenase-like oxidoreductase (DUF2520 family)